MSEIVGYLMIIVLFVGLFIIAEKTTSLLEAIAIFMVAAFIYGWVGIAVHLMG